MSKGRSCVAFRLPTPEYERLQALAKADGRTISGFVLMALRRSVLTDWHGLTLGERVTQRAGLSEESKRALERS